MKTARTLFIVLASCISLHPAGAQPGRLTARQVVERIQKNVGVAWRTGTVDTLKAGDPDTPVTGIATTMMATFDVLVRASAGGANLIITHGCHFLNYLA
jgi:hypothetical protein